MLSAIDSKDDITVWLSPEDIERLASETLEGVLVCVPKPKRQGTLSLTVDSKRALGSSKVDSAQALQLHAFIDQDRYRMPACACKTEDRYDGWSGSKILFLDISHLDGMAQFAYERFVKYRDERNQLPDRMG